VRVLPPPATTETTVHPYANVPGAHVTTIDIPIPHQSARNTTSDVVLPHQITVSCSKKFSLQKRKFLFVAAICAGLLLGLGGAGFALKSKIFPGNYTSNNIIYASLILVYTVHDVITMHIVIILRVGRGLAYPIPMLKTLKFNISLSIA
jgi:hypothetical protein